MEVEVAAASSYLASEDLDCRELTMISEADEGECELKAVCRGP
jgi:hypothetical protein